MNDTDEAESNQQREWRDIALRIRMLTDRTIRSVESEIAKAEEAESLAIDSLEKLASAALQAFMLERQAANLDRTIQRDAGF